MVLQTAAKIGGFVFGNDVLAAEALQESAHLVVGGLSFVLVGHFAYFAHGVAGCLCPIAVVKTTLLSLADSFQ